MKKKKTKIPQFFFMIMTKCLIKTINYLFLNLKNYYVILEDNCYDFYVYKKYFFLCIKSLPKNNNKETPMMN